MTAGMYLVETDGKGRPRPRGGCQLSAAAYAPPPHGSTWRRCSVCTHLTPEDSRYCRHCGTQVAPETRAVLEEGWREEENRI